MKNVFYFTALVVLYGLCCWLKSALQYFNIVTLYILPCAYLACVFTNHWARNMGWVSVGYVLYAVGCFSLAHILNSEQGRKLLRRFADWKL